MAHSKKKAKEVKQSYKPESRQPRIVENPDNLYSYHPSWSFCCCDKEGDWAFIKEHLGDAIWDKVIPFLSNIGSQTWGELFVGAEKNHHTIQIDNLNRCAQKRLAEIQPDLDTVISLRVDGTTRIYGMWDTFTFCILWYDDNHGDNETCVCRSNKKHT